MTVLAVTVKAQDPHCAASIIFEVQLGARKMQPAAGTPLLARVFESRDIGDIGCDAWFDKPELPVLIPDGSFRPSPVEAGGLH